MVFTFQANGLDSLVGRLTNAPDTIAMNKRSVFEMIGKRVTKTAKKYAPRKSGDLEKAITYKVMANEVLIMVPKTSIAANYAAVMEYGKYKKGDGTKAKGGKAGRLYIERAAKDEKKKIEGDLEGLFKGISD